MTTDPILDNFVIDRSWDMQTGARIVMDALAEVRERTGIDIRPDESIVYLAEFKIGWQGRFYTPRALLNLMAEHYGVGWRITVTRDLKAVQESATLIFWRKEGERTVDLLKKYGLAHNAATSSESEVE